MCGVLSKKRDYLYRYRSFYEFFALRNLRNLKVTQIACRTEHYYFRVRMHVSHCNSSDYQGAWSIVTPSNLRVGHHRGFRRRVGDLEDCQDILLI